MFDDDLSGYPAKGDRFLYAILDTNGKCWVILDNDTRKAEGLPSLFREGWRPVRETPFFGHNSMNPYVLVLLERD